MVFNFPSEMLLLRVAYICIRYQLLSLLEDSFPREHSKSTREMPWTRAALT
jgi:hypothetical protein